MRHPLSAAALCLALAPLPAAAQDSDDAFLDRVFAVADPESDTRVPVLCGGLYQTLSTIFADDAESVAGFTELQDAARTMATVFHILETGETDMPVERATAFVNTRFADVSAVFDDWAAFNRTTIDDPISDGIRQTFSFCEDQHAQWTSAPLGE